MNKEKSLFFTIKEAYDQNLGEQRIEQVAGDKFLVEEIEEEREYRLHGARFVARFERELHIEDVYEDSGSWHKTYGAEEVTKMYRHKARDLGMTKIEKFIRDHILTLI